MQRYKPRDVAARRNLSQSTLQLPDQPVVYSVMKAKNKATKFPVARIKKIMQKDEEVGKVAQATPVLISKALELFMASMVEEMAKVTQERGAKRVEVWHLKAAIERNEMLDFLKEIVEPIPDPYANGGDEAAAAAADAPKKKRAPRKKAAMTMEE
ncbi:hypothetical protein FRC02_001630 [Tulasnella sp. 418]|nr:hypothetical protein FRC02_001630 [Tulasnella sp. 418]